MRTVLPQLRQLLLVLVLLGIGLPGVASAGVQPAGTGEPSYTKGTNNTIWFSYTSGGFEGYRLNILYGSDQNASIYTETATVRASGSPSATVTGTSWFNMSGIPGVPSPLTEGRAWGGCVSGQDYYAYLGQWVPGLGGSSCSNGGISGQGTFTVIDRSAPSLAVAVNGTDEFARSSPLTVTMQYSDAISPPWPNANPALGANNTCIRTGGNPATVCNGQTFNYDPACSTLSSLRAKNTTFSCQINVDNTVADGPVTLCAVAADSAIPDNPNSSNQLQKSNGAAVSSTDANMSAPACGWVTLDRTPPTLSIGGPTTAQVGDLLSFTSGGSDATSGLSNAWTWSFGDNTPATTGGTGSHTFTQPGTYEVKLTSTDKAGNTAQATRTVTVTGSPTPAATPTPTPAAAPTPTPTPTGGSNNGGNTGGNGGNTGGGTTTPAPTTGASGGTVSAPPSTAQVVQSAGGNTTTVTKSSGVLDVLAPKKVRLGRKSLALALTSDSAGKADIVLIRSGRIRSKGTVTFKDAGTVGFSLKLPKGLAAGTYDLRVTLKPATGKSSVVKLKVQFAKSAKKASAARADDGVRALGPAPGLPAPGVDPALALGLK